jgi:protein TonB
MPIRINRIRLPIEQAANATGRSSRSLWLGTIASGVSHIAGGLFLGSVWGTALVQLVPPPSGPNAIQLTATQLVAVEATRDDDPEQPIPVTTLGVESSDNATGSIPQPQPHIRPDVGEMPPASLIVDRVKPLESTLVRGLETASPNLVNAPIKKPIHAAPRIVELVSTTLPKNSTVPPPPLTTHAAAVPAVPSTELQGQDAEFPPQKTYSPAPTYPASARREGLSGRVVLRVQLDADGSVVSTRVRQSSGHAILDEAAMASVRLWRFQPAKQQGIAIEQVIAVPITFRIDRTP